jgi:hypothetical protein
MFSWGRWRRQENADVKKGRTSLPFLMKPKLYYFEAAAEAEADAEAEPEAEAEAFFEA